MEGWRTCPLVPIVERLHFQSLPRPCLVSLPWNSISEWPDVERAWIWGHSSLSATCPCHWPAAVALDNSFNCSFFFLSGIFFLIVEKYKKGNKPWPIAALIRTLSRYTKVAGSDLGQGTYKNQPVNAEISGIASHCFSLSFPSSLSLWNQWIEKRKETKTAHNFTTFTF